MRRPLLATSIVFALVTASTAAHAYRPFDGTDADVAALGTFELELGPVHWYSQGESHYLLAPATVLNLGFLPRWELVIDFRELRGDRSASWRGTRSPPRHGRPGEGDPARGVAAGQRGGPEHRSGVRPAGAERQRRGSLRRLARRHHLAALELPDHPREQLARAVARRATPRLVRVGAIIEGNTGAAVRPVSEWYVSYDFGSRQTTVSGLVGGIWEATDSLRSRPGPARSAVGGERATEVRLGLTWAIGVWTPAEEKAHGGHGHRWLAMR